MYTLNITYLDENEYDGIYCVMNIIKRIQQECNFTYNQFLFIS